MGAPRIFFQGWAMRGSEERKQGLGQSLYGSQGAKLPEADDIFSK